MRFIPLTFVKGEKACINIDIYIHIMVKYTGVPMEKVS